MQKTIITSKPDSAAVYLQKLLQYKNLIVSFAIRDIKIKYAQTFLGIGWTLIQPLIGVAIFSVFFSYIFKVNTSGMPYPIFAYMGLSSWNYFMLIFNQGASSILDNKEIIKKVYFPRLVLPLSKVLTGGVDFLISMAVLLLLLPLYNYWPSWQIVFLPLIVLLNIFVGITAALWLSAAGIRKRDLFHIIPFVSNFGMWLTPVFFTMELFPAQFRFLFYINPMATVVEGYRWCLRGGEWSDPLLFINLGFLLLLFFIGFSFFRKTEDKLVELL